MRKYTFMFIAMLVVICLTACGKKDKNRSDYDNVDHMQSVETSTPEPPTATSTPTPAATATPTIYISNDDMMNSYHREDNVIEVEIEILFCRVYDKPYSGRVLGYVVNEDFITGDFYWADHNNMVGFNMSCVKRFYEPDDQGIIRPVEVDDADGVVWVYDNDAVFSIVPHPENYDSVDWGE